MRPVTRIVRYVPLVVVLLMAAAPAAFGQSIVCSEIRRGESAIQVARRVTGDSRNAYQTWFQIRNASSRFVPKSQYDRIRAGWDACVLRPIQRASARVRVDGVGAPEALASVALAAEPGVRVATNALVDVDETPPSAVSRIFRVFRALGGIDLAVLWLGAAIVVPWMGWRILDDRLARTKTTTIVMRQFAARFVQEFERPLKWSEGERPLRARVRYSAWRGRLEILLAPGNGRRYPNLADHRKNVEYDVARVMRAAGDSAFVSRPLHQEGGWVVVPLQFTPSPRPSGVTCISSF